MKQILILKDILYATDGSAAITDIKNVGTLAPGAVAVFTEDGTLVTAANVATSLLNAKSVAFFVGTANGTIKSGYVDRESCNVTKQTYRAPVTQVVLVGSDGTNGTTVVETLTGPPQEVTIKIQQRKEGTSPNDAWENYSVPVAAGETAATLYAKIITKINARASRLANAAVPPSATGNGFILTPVDTLACLEVSIGGVLTGTTVLTDGTGDSTARVYGSGTPAQIQAIWEECSPERGNTNKYYMSALFFSEVSEINNSATYDMFWFNWKQVTDHPGSFHAAANPELIIAIPTAAATLTLTNFQTILTNAFGVNSINAETGQ